MKSTNNTPKLRYWNNAWMTYPKTWPPTTHAFRTLLPPDGPLQDTKNIIIYQNVHNKHPDIKSPNEWSSIILIAYTYHTISYQKYTTTITQQ